MCYGCGHFSACLLAVVICQQKTFVSPESGFSAEIIMGEASFLSDSSGQSQFTALAVHLSWPFVSHAAMLLLGSLWVVLPSVCPADVEELLGHLYG